MFKRFFKFAGRQLGVEIRRFDPSNSFAAQLGVMLSWHGVNIVLDVGANAGQYGQELRSHIGYKGRIVSFEPMKRAYGMLTNVAARDPCWEVGARAAIGAGTGTVRMNIAGNSVSSSVLPMLEAHSNAAPESRYQSSEDVPLVQLDSVALSYLDADAIPFLKIDTQGYESHVLDGAKETASRAIGIQIELSLIPLYKGQMLMPQLVERITKMGFDLWGITPTFADPTSGRMLQMDAVFFRTANQK